MDCFGRIVLEGRLEGRLEGLEGKLVSLILSIRICKFIIKKLGGELLDGSKKFLSISTDCFLLDAFSVV